MDKRVLPLAPLSMVYLERDLWGGKASGKQGRRVGLASQSYWLLKKRSDEVCCCYFSAEILKKRITCYSSLGILDYRMSATVWGETFAVGQFVARFQKEAGYWFQKHLIHTHSTTKSCLPLLIMLTPQFPFSNFTPSYLYPKKSKESKAQLQWSLPSAPSCLKWPWCEQKRDSPTQGPVRSSVCLSRWRGPTCTPHPALPKQAMGTGPEPWRNLLLMVTSGEQHRRDPACRFYNSNIQVIILDEGCYPK